MTNIDSTETQIRAATFEREITKTWVSFNRPLTGHMVGMKTETLSQMLGNLRTEKIEAFFLAVRGLEENLPSDGRIMRLFRDRYNEFGYPVNDAEYAGRYLTADEATAIGSRLVALYPHLADEIRAIVNECYRAPAQMPDRDFMARFSGLIGKMTTSMRRAA